MASGERAAWVEIDAVAIRHNLHLIRRLAGKARVYVVCKGEAYGFDAALVGTLAAQCGMDALACGDPAEVRAIRAAGIDLPILLYGSTLAEDLPGIASSGVVVTAHDRGSLQVCVERRLSFAVKLDAGFGRLGFRMGELDDVVAAARANPGAGARGVYTHLADAADPASIAAQVECFNAMCDAIEAAGWHGLERMVASSRVLIDHPELQLDAVNPGRLVYGLLEPPWDQRVDARCALAGVKAHIMSLKRVASGSRVGYDALPLRRDTLLAVVPYGFSDGYPRLPAGGAALVRGERVALIGPRHTEHCVLDVTDIGGVSLGDEVVFLGSQGRQTIAPDALVQATGVPLIELIPRLARMGNRRITGM